MEVTPDYAAAMEAVRPYTLTTYHRLSAMAGAVKMVDEFGIAGDIVECGVWRGGNIMLARKISPERVCWLYDTFEGMTEPEDVDRTRSGAPAMGRYKPGQAWCRASLDEVKEAMAATGTFDESKLRFVVGDVADTLDGQDLPERIAVLRLDTDWYASTRKELEVLYPRLERGGVLIVDDYGHWQGAKRAVEEYFGPRLTFEPIDYSAIKMVKP